MVQGNTKGCITNVNYNTAPSKSVGAVAESFTKQVQPKKQEEKKSKCQDKKYGAWGPVFKNRQNFLDMHYC